MNPDTNPQDIVVNNPLNAMQAGEQHIDEIKRHPIGIIYTYLGLGILISVLAYVAFVLLPSANDSLGAIGYLVFIVMTFLGVSFAFASQIIYWGNRWVVTSDSITQIEQTSLFHKQSSQLSLENVEDVSAVKHGIMSNILNFGLLKVQTAGEHGKFWFQYCPDPEKHARTILNAREQFMLKEDSRHHQANPSVTTTP